MSDFTKEVEEMNKLVLTHMESRKLNLFEFSYILRAVTDMVTRNVDVRERHAIGVMFDGMALPAPQLPTAAPMPNQDIQHRPNGG